MKMRMSFVQKEAGLLSIATDKETELTAYRQLMDYVKRDNMKNRIFIVHRLDRIFPAL